MSTLIEFLFWSGMAVLAIVALAFTEKPGRRAEWVIWGVSIELILWAFLGFTWALGWWNP
jgi:hypothetical protein